jgi:hypothetical protein
MSVELINKVRVDRQISDKRMAVGEGEGFLFTLLADQAAKIFKAIGASFKRLRARAIDGSSRVLLDQSAQAHDGTQRFGSAPFKGVLSPLTAWLTDDRCSADPIAAGTDWLWRSKLRRALVG